MTRGRGKDLIVQQSFPRPRPTTNPYLRMLGEAIARQPGVGVRTFSWRSALLARYDVFHVHWPEILVTGQSPLKALVRQALTLLLVLRLAVLRIPIVRTQHNLETHEELTPIQRALVGLIERRTALIVRLNDFTPVREGLAVATIPLGHYRGWYGELDETVHRETGRVAYVGLIRPYKGVERLLEAFRGVAGDVRLTAAGNPSTPDLAAELTRLAERDDRIDLDLRYLDESDLVATVRRAELVVLPFRQMHNSSSALTALSLDRPVLVPANDVNELLADEVGRDWVQVYRDELTADDITRALEGVANLGDGDRPDLSLREWTDAGKQHVAAYRRAIRIMGRKRRRGRVHE